jgi:hypothetical protein
VSALIFLLVVVVVSAVGSAILWYRHRTPVTFDSGIKDFQREMRALAPPPDGRDERHRGG